ncbi:uncharacterized protein B0H64DRAFT_383960 [Chaetomium fimeti]|uniref:Aminoglycoside phosphotransferase domain-containing protein n=1 Tax=Chaetomium fimeti TaxID=1854472 RepID=A0AAE0LXQ6_9PEZI|nr:hypothetical protein B0H64DRAFT_383960 [Chaetomium fimeti]
MAKSLPVTLPTAEDIIASTARLSALEKVTTVATQHDLPYLDIESLPDGVELPTVEEILATPRQRVSTDTGAPIYRVGKHFAVKYGSCDELGFHISFHEGENMLFVQESTNIPIPKLYAMFHDEETGLNFIVQEFIPGHQLGEIWNGLDRAQRQAIALQIRRNMDELRSIPSPGYYGGIRRQPIRDCHFITDRVSHRPHPDKAISGPHETEEEWTEAMLRYLDTDIVNTRPTERQAIPYADAYRKVFNGHNGSVFTHSHLYGRNLILREDGTVVIVNWQNAGWYPTYWEYCCSRIGDRPRLPHHGWEAWVDEMLDAHIAEHDLLLHHMTFIDI